MQEQGSTSNGKTLGLVVRVSRVAGREGESFQSPRQQERIATSVAKRLGYDVKVFEEDTEGRGVPGSVPFDERPGMSKALGLVEAGKLDGIIVAALDRLVREDVENGVTLKSFQKRIRAARAVLVVPDAPEASIEDPDDRGVRGMAALGLGVRLLADTAQREEAGEKWRASRQDAIKRKIHVSTPPAGYTPSVTGTKRDGRPEHGPLEKNEHAPAVLAAFEARAKGSSWSQVARLLTTLGVPTGKDRRRMAEELKLVEAGKLDVIDDTLTPWSIKSAQTTLSNPTYLGQVRSDTFVNDDAHDPIVDAALWRRVRARDQQKGSWVDGAKREKALLAGVLKCANCGGSMTRDSGTRADGSRHYVYRCRNFGGCSDRPTIGLDLVEQYVSEWAIDAIQVRVLHPAHGGNDAKRAKLEAALSAAESELEAFVAATSAAQLGPELFGREIAKRKRAVDEAVAALQAIEDDAEAFPGLPPEMLRGARREGFARGLWTSMTGTERNRMLRRHFPTGIPVKRGRGVEERIGDLDAFALQEVADAA